MGAARASALDRKAGPGTGLVSTTERNDADRHALLRGVRDGPCGRADERGEREDCDGFGARRRQRGRGTCRVRRRRAPGPDAHGPPHDSTRRTGTRRCSGRSGCRSTSSRATGDGRSPNGWCAGRTAPSPGRSWTTRSAWRIAPLARSSSGSRLTCTRTRSRTTDSPARAVRSTGWIRDRAGRSMTTRRLSRREGAARNLPAEVMWSMTTGATGGPI